MRRWSASPPCCRRPRRRHRLCPPRNRAAGVTPPAPAPCARRDDRDWRDEPVGRMAAGVWPGAQDGAGQQDRAAHAAVLPGSLPAPPKLATGTKARPGRRAASAGHGQVAPGGRGAAPQRRARDPGPGLICPHSSQPARRRRPHPLQARRHASALAAPCASSTAFSWQINDLLLWAACGYLCPRYAALQNIGRSQRLGPVSSGAARNPNPQTCPQVASRFPPAAGRIHPRWPLPAPESARRGAGRAGAAAGRRCGSRQAA